MSLELKETSRQFINEDYIYQEDGKYLTFSLNDEEYCINIRCVSEIIGIQKIINLPQAPFFIKGAINLRGKIIPVIDIRLRFNMEYRKYDMRTCIIVVDISNILTGLIVDLVSEVIEIESSEIDPSSGIDNNISKDYISGFAKIDNRVKILLDVNYLINNSHVENIKE